MTYIPIELKLGAIKAPKFKLFNIGYKNKYFFLIFGREKYIYYSSLIDSKVTNFK